VGRVLQTKNGSAAVIMIQEEKPDIVLLDVQMSGGTWPTPLSLTIASNQSFTGQSMGPSRAGARAASPAYQSPRMPFTSRYSSRPNTPYSRPLPDWRYPPNGAWRDQAG